MTKNDVKRVFIVGCPRSGTTLLQSILATHQEVFSLPETHYFNKVVSSRLMKLLGLANSKEVREILFNIIDENVIELSDRIRLEDLIPKSSILIHTYITAYSDILDKIAALNKNSVWVEKTPSHIHRIDLIEKHLPDANFIHIIRNGKDVVASLYEVTRDYSEEWGGSRSIETCVWRWNRDVELSIKYRQKENHFLIRYEDLVTEPEQQTRNLCAFLNLDFDPRIYMLHKIGAKSVIRNSQDWVKNAQDPIKDKNDTKFEILFDETEKDWIRNNLRDYDLL